MISIVIPTLDEADRLPALLAALAAESEPHEVIVADGGSGDGTAALAAAAGARVVAAPRGRGRQVAAGAAAAGGEILWILHADSAVRPGALGAIRRALADPAVVGGNFRLIFDGERRFSRWLTGFYACVRRSGFYYGDSGIFARRSVYERLGGIKPLALMEDYDFVRRLERAGPTACIAHPPLVTSSRRFAGRRPARIFALWLAIHLLFHIGVSPDFLAKLYRSAQHAPGSRQSPWAAARSYLASLRRQS
jgi:rSAM/selenodomain-associated transferase 2